MEPRGLSVKIRQYPRKGGVTWRWWVYDRPGDTHLDTGVIVGGDRDQAEHAAKDAIKRLATTAPRTTGL
jgi:hypothetical protein